MFGFFALISLLFVCCTAGGGGHNNYRDRNHGKAVANFSIGNSGVDGSIVVSKRHVIVDLNFSAVNTSLIPNGEECFEGGLKYHIHELWDYDHEIDQVGSDECGATYTGGHWDPWLACGSASGSDDCSNNGGCINVTDYDCDTDTFEESQYACEVGDWSGKYGLLELDNSSISDVYRSDCSRWEVKPSDLAAFNETVFSSVVIHCNSGERAFCAPFVYSDSYDFNEFDYWRSDDCMRDSIDESLTVEFVVDDDDGDDDDDDEDEDEDEDDDEETIELKIMEDGKFQLEIPEDSVDLCDEYKLELYEEWNSDEEYAIGSDCNSSLLGSLYDPTHACHPQSNSEYCIFRFNQTSVRCNDTEPTEVEYDCDRYYCAVGDISGRAGNFVLNSGGRRRHSSEEQYARILDVLPPDMDDYKGRGLLLTCVDGATTNVTVFCAAADPYVFTTSEIPVTSTECVDIDPCDDNDDCCSGYCKRNKCSYKGGRHH